jgi:hypothetical protein
MRHALIRAAIATALVAVAHAARSAPDFSGSWTYDQARSTTCQQGVQSDGDSDRFPMPSFCKGSFSMLGCDLTVTQDGKTLTLTGETPSHRKVQFHGYPPVETTTYVDAVRYSLVFALDGSQSVNMHDPDADQMQTSSVATWNEDALVILTTPKPADSPVLWRSFTRKLRLGAGTLTVEETKGSGVDSVTSTTVYLRKQ